MKARYLFPLLFLVGLILFAPQTTHAQGDTYDDPFEYCAAVGTIDAPDASYTGAALPDSIRDGLELSNVPEDLAQAGTFWRCMDGNVYGCFVGANIPCEEKADTSETPTEGMEQYCAENPDAEFIPAAATGRTTIYEWGCEGETPTILRQVSEVDAAGYPAIFWTMISPPTEATEAPAETSEEAPAETQEEATEEETPAETPAEAPSTLPSAGGENTLPRSLLIVGGLLLAVGVLARRRLARQGVDITG